MDELTVDAERGLTRADCNYTVKMKNQNWQENKLSIIANRDILLCITNLLLDKHSCEN